MTTCGIMIDQEPKETMQKSHEASLRCPQTKAFHFNIHENGNPVKGVTEVKEERKHHQDGVAESEMFMRNGTFAPPDECISRHFYQLDFGMWPPFHHPEFQKMQQVHWNTFENHFYPINRDQPFLVENQIQYVPIKMIPQTYPCDFQLQEFQYFVVIDFEATCDKERNPHPQEIIEFPSVIVNSVTGKVVDQFREYIRPSHHQLLTDFCKELTGIQQSQVDKGISLSDALLRHDKWLEEKGVKQQNFAIVTWSNWDCRVMLESECRFKRIRKPPYFNRWINLKVPFQEVFGGLRCNLKEAVQKAGLTWEGRAHCGLDDALNTAHLLAYLMHRGFRFSITNTLLWQEHPHPHPHPENSPTGSSIPSHYLNPKQPMPLVQFRPHMEPMEKEGRIYCLCGVRSSKRMVRKPGPKHGSYFFGCGNWTATRGPLCHFFEWASP